MRKTNLFTFMLAAAWLLASCYPPTTAPPPVIIPITPTLQAPPPTETLPIVEPTLVPTEAIWIESPTATPTSSPRVIATHPLEPSPTPTQAQPTAASTPLVTPQVECSSTYPTRLYLGAYAVVSPTPPLPNRLRTEPSTQGGASTILGWIQPDEEVVLLQGPTCAEGWVWWQVASLSSGLSGWTSEGDGDDYWLIPLQPEASAGETAQTAVTLTANQVDGANDIEAAIERATAVGARPGMVILDGRQGAFVFTDADRSINMYVSNLVLRGVNQAVIQNCGDGLFFDNFPLKNILVEGIEFICEGEGVAASGAFENVTLFHNIFRSVNSGISLGGASRNWLILENEINSSNGNGITITGAQKIMIMDNHIAAYSGILLQGCSQFNVQQNVIQASYQGILLAQESWQNWVQMNTILGVSRSGITLESDANGNHILANKVLCALGASCWIVESTPELAEMNTIDLGSE